MNKKLKVTHKFLDNVACNYPEKKNIYWGESEELCQGEGLTVEEVNYFVVCLVIEFFSK